MLRSSRSTVFALMLLAGCPLDGPADDDGLPPAPPPPPPAAAASYALISDLDIPADALLPQPGYDAISALRALRSNPGAAIFDLLDQAGVPLLADLKAALPDVLESRVEGFIGDALADVLDVPALDRVIALADTAVGDVDMLSQLVLADGQATHRVTALRFGAEAAPELRIDVPVEALDPLLSFEASAASAVVAEDTGAYLLVGDHFFGLPLGGYAWIALEQLVERETGGSIRDALADALDCPTVAHTVAAKGALGVQVGHEAELLELCETGLDLVEAKLHEQVTALVIDTLRFASGRARLVDADGDGIAESLAQGSWDVRVDVGLGARAATGSFSGTR